MENIIAPGAGPAAQPSDLIKNSTAETFVADVIDASQEVPVIVDFWATWCEPCKQLGPVLEKVVTEAGGAVKLVKVDIDQNQQIAQQLRIQSVPTVFAFYQGRPMDGFSGAQPESQIKAFVDKLISASGGQAASSPVAEALEQAKTLMDAGDTGAAGQLFGQVLSHEPDNLPAAVGLARCCIAGDDLAGARETLDKVPEDKRGEQEVAAAFAALELAEKTADVGDLGQLRAALAQDETNHQARFDLALALFAADSAEDAIDELIEIIRRDRQWNDQAARTQLLQFFEAQGMTDPLTISGRRKLSALLFS
ncbi:MAG: thioredoxin [Alphaproteobacteria bacterium]